MFSWVLMCGDVWKACLFFLRIVSTSNSVLRPIPPATKANPKNVVIHEIHQQWESKAPSTQTGREREREREDNTQLNRTWIQLPKCLHLDEKQY